ncbi:hypothetical protein IWZ00DRAFT_177990 [Phyllosticta capitalensis]
MEGRGRGARYAPGQHFVCTLHRICGTARRHAAVLLSRICVRPEMRSDGARKSKPKDLEPGDPLGHPVARIPFRVVAQGSRRGVGQHQFPSAGPSKLRKLPRSQNPDCASEPMTCSSSSSPNTADEGGRRRSSTRKAVPMASNREKGVQDLDATQLIRNTKSGRAHRGLPFFAALDTDTSSRLPCSKAPWSFLSPPKELAGLDAEHMPR